MLLQFSVGAKHKMYIVDHKTFMEIIKIRYESSVLFKTWRACFWHGIYNFPQYLIYLLMDVSRKFLYSCYLWKIVYCHSQVTSWSINRTEIKISDVRNASFWQGWQGKTRINFKMMGKSVEYKGFINKLYMSVCLSRF